MNHPRVFVGTRGRGCDERDTPAPEGPSDRPRGRPLGRLSLHFPPQRRRWRRDRTGRWIPLGDGMRWARRGSDASRSRRFESPLRLGEGWCGWKAGLLASGSSDSPSLPSPLHRASGVVRQSSPVTATGSRRILTDFPQSPGPQCRERCGAETASGADAGGHLPPLCRRRRVSGDPRIRQAARRPQGDIKSGRRCVGKMSHDGSPRYMLGLDSAPTGFLGCRPTRRTGGRMR